MFPRVVDFKDGFIQQTIDLDTKRRTFAFVRVPGKPHDTFKVVRTDRTVPKAREFRQGVFRFRVTQKDITFSRPLRRSQPRPSNPFRRRRRP